MRRCYEAADLVKDPCDGADVEVVAQKLCFVAKLREPVKPQKFHGFPVRA